MHHLAFPKVVKVPSGGFSDRSVSPWGLLLTAGFVASDATDLLLLPVLLPWLECLQSAPIQHLPTFMGCF